MFRSLILGRIFGVPIKLHWSFYLVIIYVLLSILSNPAEGFGLLIVLAILSVSVIGHELSHSLMARKFKIQTHDILLTPIGGIARMAYNPANSKQEILIASAGPIFSLVLGAATSPFLYTVMYQHSEITGFVSALTASIYGFLALVSILNLVLGVFNLIPAFPMDGGRIFRAILTPKLGILRATEIAASVGKFIALFGLVYGIFNSMFNIVIIAIFIFVTSSIELSVIRKREMLRQMQMGGGSPFDQQFQVDLMNLFKIFGSQINQAQNQYYQNTQHRENPQNHDQQYNPGTDYIEYKGQQVFMPEKSDEEKDN